MNQVVPSSSSSLALVTSIVVLTQVPPSRVLQVMDLRSVQVSWVWLLSFTWMMCPLVSSHLTRHPHLQSDLVVLRRKQQPQQRLRALLPRLPRRSLRPQHQQRPQHDLPRPQHLPQLPVRILLQGLTVTLRQYRSLPLR